MTQAQIIEGTGEELIEVLSRQPKERYRLIKLTHDQEHQTFEEALTQAMHWTLEEIAAARERLIQASPAPRELPDGQTLEDVVLGKWPGGETDEEIFEALERLP
jgi:hypothetical protein